jgi:signal transduction histidine kinase
MDDQTISSLETTNDFLQTISDCVMIVDQKRVVSYANQSAMQMLGLQKKDIIGKEFETAVYLHINGKPVELEDSPLTLSKKANNFYSTQSDQAKEYTMGRRDRSIISVSLTVMLRGKSYVVVFKDSSADQKIDRAKSEFIALVSHQLRTPINIISWYTEKLTTGRRGNLNTSQTAYLDEIHRSNKRVVDLVQAIVNVSRSDLGKLKHKHEPVDLSSLTKKCYDDVSAELADKYVSSELHIQESDYTFPDSDQELVSVVVKNVLKNAFQYTLAGKVSVNLKPVEAGDTLDNQFGEGAVEDGGLITIKDQGLGVPDDEKKSIFNKLFRASNVQTLEIMGVGLGLYVAQSFISELGGKIWFESELRSGSVFYIYIPGRLADSRQKTSIL